jgi:hypothetical protein
MMDVEEPSFNLNAEHNYISSVKRNCCTSHYICVLCCYNCVPFNFKGAVLCHTETFSVFEIRVRVSRFGGSWECVILVGKVEKV